MKRALAYLHRIALALEALARQHGSPAPRPIAPTQFDIASVDEWNAEWRRTHPSEADFQ
jgi:hypothetical protein